MGELSRSRKADFVFNATILFDGVEIETGLLCRVYLPVKLSEPLELQFSPTEEQAKKLRGYILWQYSVTGETKAFTGEVMVRFAAKEVFANKGVQTAYFGKDVSESKMVGNPIDFTITHLLNEEITEGKPISTDANFWITPNTLLEPGTILEHSYTGKVEVERIWSFDLETDPYTTFHFDQHYHYRDNEEGDMVSFSELVAKASLNVSADSNKIFETLNILDGVLLLASFAARQRCICLGWDASDSKNYVKQFVRNRAIPRNNPKTTYKDGLIEKWEFKEFMRTAYSAFAKVAPQDPLRRAISLTVPFKDSTVEGEFVALYTALEMLVLQFRRISDLEFILPNNPWKKIRKELKTYIESMALGEHNDKKFLIQDKLSELNRVSFGTAFDQFCANYSIDLADLWPVNNSATGASLSQIRNKLVHGEHFGPDHYEALMFAELHLRWTVERMLLAVLDWHAEKSNVSRSFLSNWIAYKEWQSKQPDLS